jgi:hypothetical protein
MALPTAVAAVQGGVVKMALRVAWSCAFPASIWTLTF